MHIGEANDICPDLYIDRWKVNTIEEIEANEYKLVDELGEVYKIDKTEEEKYLGDVITSNGKNDTNIKKRTERGMGIITQIISILEEICFGPFFFEVALLLRNSLFISSILINSEV